MTAKPNPKWGYSKRNGPHTWSNHFPQADGELQSPVDISTSLMRSGNMEDTRFPPLVLNYQIDSCRYLSNSGHGWKVDCEGNANVLKGGPVDGEFTLKQFHCHWGPHEGIGSEHTIDGKSYSGELHIVHWNSSKYESFEEALNHPDGLTVVGIFLEVGEPHNEELSKLAALLPRVTYKDDKINLNHLVTIDIKKFLPRSTHYWTYPGSLTTPPCNESVNWIVFKEPILVSKRQLEVFRSLKTYHRNEPCPTDDEEECIKYNNRPVRSLGNREIRECGGH